jgi:hypothetical protein
MAAAMNAPTASLLTSLICEPPFLGKDGFSVVAGRAYVDYNKAVFHVPVATLSSARTSVSRPNKTPHEQRNFQRTARNRVFERDRVLIPEISAAPERALLAYGS